MSEWLRRIWYLINRRRMEHELQREMESHREMMGEPVRFGNTLRLREEARDVWSWNWLDDLRRDLRYAWHGLRSSPGFTIGAILILSFGIGLNVTAFQIFHIAYFKPLAVRDLKSLVRFYPTAKTFRQSDVPYPAAQLIRTHNDVLSAVMNRTEAPVVWEDDLAASLRGAFISANWFDELGYGPAMGRVFHQAIEGKDGAPPVTVISHTFWQKELQSDPNIIGKSVRVNGRPATVVGVAPADFPELDIDSDATQLWLPIEQIDYFQPGSTFKTSFDKDGGNAMYGRLRDGISAKAATDGLRPAMEALASQHPGEFVKDEHLEAALGTAHFLMDGWSNGLWPLAIAVGVLSALVLLITCANLANMVLSRSLGRVRELSVRVALGASHWRVMRHLLAESTLLTGLGAACGLLMGLWAARVFTVLTGFPPSLDFSPDWKTILAAFAAAIFAVVVAGLIPAWKVSGRDLSSAMKDGGQQTSAGLNRTRLRSLFIALQVASSCILLVASDWTIRDYQRLFKDIGFRFEGLAVLEAPLNKLGAKRSEAAAYWNAIRAPIAGDPETAGAVLVKNPPWGHNADVSRFDDVPGLTVATNEVEPDFFNVMQIPLLAGRTFQAADDFHSTVIVSKRLALTMYGSLDVLGSKYPKSKPIATIVGIVADARTISFGNLRAVQAYFPLNPDTLAEASLVVRAKTDSARLASPMRSAAHSYDERIIPKVRLLRADYADQVNDGRNTILLIFALAATALAIALAGICGVVQYGASLRKKEIGIRIALGAGRNAVFGLLLKQLLWPICLASLAGIGLGVVIIPRTLGGQGVLNPFDMVMMPCLVIIASMIAALSPAVRVLRIDVADTLRHE